MPPVEGKCSSQCRYVHFCRRYLRKFLAILNINWNMPKREKQHREGRNSKRFGLCMVVKLFRSIFFWFFLALFSECWLAAASTWPHEPQELHLLASWSHTERKQEHIVSSLVYRILSSYLFEDVPFYSAADEFFFLLCFRFAEGHQNKARNLGWKKRRFAVFFVFF